MIESDAVLKKKKGKMLENNGKLCLENQSHKYIYLNSYIRFWEPF